MTDFFGTTVRVILLDDPDPPSLMQVGIHGTTTYAYKVVGIRRDTHTAASEAAVITTGPAELSLANHINIVPPLQPGITTWDIWRTQGGPAQGRIGTLQARHDDSSTLLPLHDTGLEASGLTPPEDNTTGQAYLTEVPLTSMLIGQGGATLLPLPYGTEGQVLTMTLGRPGFRDLPAADPNLLTFQRATVVLDAAAMNALHTTPVQLLPAPGPGLATVITLLYASYTPGSIGFGDWLSHGLQLTSGATDVFDIHASAFSQITWDGLTSRPDYALAFAAMLDLSAMLGGSGLTDHVNQSWQLTQTTDATGSGSVDAAHLALHTAGHDYVVGDVVTIASGGANCYIYITGVTGGGDITSWVVLLSGSGYETGNDLATSGGSGTDATWDIGMVGDGDGSLTLTLFYTVIGAT